MPPVTSPECTEHSVCRFHILEGRWRWVKSSVVVLWSSSIQRGCHSSGRLKCGFCSEQVVMRTAVFLLFFFMVFYLLSAFHVLFTLQYLVLLTLPAFWDKFSRILVIRPSYFVSFQVYVAVCSGVRCVVSLSPTYIVLFFTFAACSEQSHARRIFRSTVTANTEIPASAVAHYNTVDLKCVYGKIDPPQRGGVLNQT